MLHIRRKNNVSAKFWWNHLLSQNALLLRFCHRHCALITAAKRRGCNVTFSCNVRRPANLTFSLATVTLHRLSEIKCFEYSAGRAYRNFNCRHSRENVLLLFGSTHSVENRAASIAPKGKMNVCKTRLHIAIWCVKYFSNRSIITVQQMVSPFKSNTVTKVGN